MPAGRIKMRKMKEVMRLRFLAGLSNRKIAKCTGLGKSAVSKHVGRAEELGLCWSTMEKISEEALEAMLYPVSEAVPTGRALPDWNEVAKQLRRKGVTKLLLWEEYKEDHGRQAYSYSRYCELYADWKGGVA